MLIPSHETGTPKKGPRRSSNQDGGTSGENIQHTTPTQFSDASDSKDLSLLGRHAGFQVTLQDYKPDGLLRTHSYLYNLTYAMENGPPRMSVDQMLWMGIGSNPGKMLVRYLTLCMISW